MRVVPRPAALAAKAAKAANGEGSRHNGRRGATRKQAPQPAPARRRPAKAAGSRNGKKNARGSDAETVAAVAVTKTAEPSAPAYDSSDSFENRVIGLRGDQSHDAKIRDEGHATLRSTHVRVDNGNRWRGSDLDTFANNARGLGYLSNGKYPNSDKRGNGVAEGTSGGSSKVRPHGFVPGQLVWAKFARFPWWPAQVMDEREANAGRVGDPGSEADILVRFFGTYDYGWVNPFENLSDFDVKLMERSRIRKKALQKGVEEATAFQTSGKLPELWGPVPKTSQNAHNAQSNGKAEHDKPQDVKGSEKIPRKRKPKVVFEEKDVEKKPQKVARRLRVMRQLGLVAPAGSLFALPLNF